MTHDLAEYEDRLIESAQAIIDAWNPDELEDETLVPIPVGLIVNLDDAVSEFTRACQAPHYGPISSADVASIGAML